MDVQAMRALRLIKQLYTTQPQTNVFDNTKTSTGYLNGGVQNSTSGYFTTDFMPISVNDSISYSFDNNMGSNHLVALYDANKVYLTSISGTLDGTSTYRTALVSTANAKFMKISFSSASMNTAMVTRNKPYPSSYQSYSLVNFLDKSYKLSEDNLSAITTVQTSTNLLDTTKITAGNFLTGSALTANANYFTTDYIPVKNGDTVYYGFDTGMGSNNKLSYYDASKTYISNILGTPDANNRYRQVTFNNANVAYIRASFSNSNLLYAMVTVNNAYPSAFFPYSSTKFLNDSFALNNTQLSQIQQLSASNVLNGKIVSFNGDSISYGAGYAGGYGQIIANRNSMIYENKSVSGGTITANTYNNDSTPRHWVSRDITNMRADADYIILEGGVNDGSLGVPIGSVSSGFTATLDDTTFCGAFESMLSQAIARYPGKKIGYVFVHNMTSSQATYNPYAYQILEKWGIPYIDLYKKCPPLNSIAYLKANYTIGDGWHPNQAGYLQYYCDKIEAWMKSL